MDARTEETSDQLMLRIMRDVNGQVFRAFGNKVLGGPFANMIIPGNTYWDDGNASTKLFGVYEHELHDAIDHAIWRRPQALINVGAAEGYYAIGMARKMPSLDVYAFDTNKDSRTLCAEFAAKNEVASRILILDGCQHPEEMHATNVPEHKLYIIDCEGSEYGLIDLDACPPLRTSDLIIECHDFLIPDVSSILADRLAATHAITRILPRLPDFNQFSFVRDAPNVMSVLALTEKRPMPCCWMACWARVKGST